ncbi:MAG TPA: 6-hydroxymethylpterin diphosphokinase MptE-like protein [Magnetospirillaceae bacterium]
MTVVAVESDMRAENMAAFERFLPAYAELLREYVPQTRLVENLDGSCDVEFRGQCLYDTAGDGTTGPDLARRMIDELKTSPRGRIFATPFGSSSLDQTTSVYITQLLKQGVDDGVTFLRVPNGHEAYHLIVMGMGLGYHLAEALKFCEPFSICIVEPNLDFLYHSLSTFDWVSLLERRKEWPWSVSLLQSDNAAEMSERMRGHCRNANPSAVDSTLTIASYPNDIMSAAQKTFAKDAHLIHSGLGFFSDELEMVRASYFNLVAADNFRVFKHSPGTRAGLPAFIVGSGPSLDQDIEFVKANQDRAVIISCGSALGALMTNGIRPDFQVQLENGEAARDMLVSMAKKYDYSGICLIGSNTVSPQTRALFGEGVYFMRQALTSYAMFSPGVEYSLSNAGPTVTNTGLEIALRSGFTEIYLLGCDLGARSPDHHHSRFSPYHMANRTAEYDAAVTFIQKFPVRELGNFGGIVFTNEIMTWSRQSMEECIRGNAATGARVFNCSDGLRIKGARPQVADGIRIAALQRPKAEIVAELIERWPEASAFGFNEKWHATDWRGAMRRYADQLIEVCESNPDRSHAFLHQMGLLMIPDHYRPAHFEEYCLRGTLFMAVIATDYYCRRVHPPEKRGMFQQLAYAGIAETIQTMLDQADWFFDHIDEIHTNVALKDALVSWTPDKIPSPTV